MTDQPQPAMQEHRCRHCGGFFASTDKPEGRITAYCRGCRRVRTLVLPKIVQLTPCFQEQAA